MDLNVQFGGTKLPVVGARLTTREAQRIYWTWLADGSDPAVLTADVNGQLQGYAVSQGGLQLPITDSKITLFYRAGGGVSLVPALVSPPPLSGPATFTEGQPVAEAVKEYAHLLTTEAAASKAKA